MKKELFELELKKAIEFLERYGQLNQIDNGEKRVVNHLTKTLKDPLIIAEMKQLPEKNNRDRYSSIILTCIGIIINVVIDGLLKTKNEKEFSEKRCMIMRLVITGFNLGVELGKDIYKNEIKDK